MGEKPGVPTVYLTADEAARILRVAPRTLIVWAMEGRVPASRTPGGHWRFVEADLLLALEPARRRESSDDKAGPA